MYLLIKSFVDLALLRLTPQDLPASTFLMRVMLCVHAGIGTVFYLMEHDLLTAVTAAVAGTALMALLTAALLWATRLRERFVQTLTALAGVDVVIGMLSLPLSGWLGRATASGAQPPTAGDSAAALLLIGLLGWNLAAAGHILRHALSTPLSIGVVLALIFYLVSVSLMKMLLPEAT